MAHHPTRQHASGSTTEDIKETSSVVVQPVAKLRGQPKIPGDKSVSHRGLIFGALASGETRIANLLDSGDVNSTASCLRQMGVKITQVLSSQKSSSAESFETIVASKGVASLKSPDQILDCGNSGTTMRLLMGVLSGVGGFVGQMTGDSSLVKRPMKRVAEPLRLMGANIELTSGDFAPLTVRGGPLRAADYELKIASAQIKTAVILAALQASGTTRIFGEIHSRDHTERLLSHFGVAIESTPTEILIRGGQAFKPNFLKVPGDPSTAAFWLAGACLVPDSEIELCDVSLNPSRIGFFRALERMGAKVTSVIMEEKPEPIGKMTARTSRLRGITIVPAEVPSLIDELPMLAVLATQAHGTTEVTGAEELRVKETDRIEAVAKNLRAMGAKIETRPDGFVIEGPQLLHGAEIDSFHDHRIAMAFSIATLVASSPSTIQGAECVGISYPAFFKTLNELSK